MWEIALTLFSLNSPTVLPTLPVQGVALVGYSIPVVSWAEAEFHVLSEGSAIRACVNILFAVQKLSVAFLSVRVGFCVLYLPSSSSNQDFPLYFCLIVLSLKLYNWSSSRRDETQMLNLLRACHTFWKTWRTLVYFGTCQTLGEQAYLPTYSLCLFVLLVCL